MRCARSLICGGDFEGLESINISNWYDQYMDAPSSLDEVFALSPERFGSHWKRIDELIATERQDSQFAAWERIAARIGDSPHSKGMPFFRMAILKLLSHPDESIGIQLLEAARREDDRFGPDSGQLPHRMGAYRLLSLVKDYFQELHRLPSRDWQKGLLSPENRSVLMMTLLMVYNRSVVEILDMPSYTFQAFFKLVTDRDLCRFAAENYYCAETLVQAFFLEGQAIVKTRDECPLARAIVGLLGGCSKPFLPIDCRK